MRDRLKTPEYFCEFIAKDRRRRDKFVARAREADSPERHFQLLRRAYRMQYGVTVAEYSRGAAMDEFFDHVHDCLGLFLKAMNAAKSCREYVEREYAGGYDEVFSLLGIAVLSKVDVTTASALAGAVDFFGARDALWEAMLESLGAKGRPVVTSTVWPNAYQRLLAAHQSSAPDEGRIALHAFFDNWYAAMEPTAWYDNHKSDAATYYGYWCFEGAAVAQIARLDVGDVRKHPAFPAELFDHSMAADTKVP